MLAPGAFYTKEVQNVPRVLAMRNARSVAMARRVTEGLLVLAVAAGFVGGLHVLAAAVQAAAVPDTLRSVLPPGSELALLVAGNDELLGLGEMLRADVDMADARTTQSAARTLLQVRDCIPPTGADEVV
jgi:hypothetical protein